MVGGRGRLTPTSSTASSSASWPEPSSRGAGRITWDAAIPSHCTFAIYVQGRVNHGLWVVVLGRAAAPTVGSRRPTIRLLVRHGWRRAVVEARGTLRERTSCRSHRTSTGKGSKSISPFGLSVPRVRPCTVRSGASNWSSVSKSSARTSVSIATKRNGPPEPIECTTISQLPAGIPWSRNDRAVIGIFTGGDFGATVTPEAITVSLVSSCEFSLAFSRHLAFTCRFVVVPATCINGSIVST